jgi:hypothetical protein
MSRSGEPQTIAPKRSGLPFPAMPLRSSADRLAASESRIRRSHTARPGYGHRAPGSWGRSGSTGCEYSSGGRSGKRNGSDRSVRSAESPPMADPIRPIPRIGALTTPLKATRRGEKLRPRPRPHSSGCGTARAPRRADRAKCGRSTFVNRCHPRPSRVRAGGSDGRRMWSMPAASHRLSVPGSDDVKSASWRELEGGRAAGRAGSGRCFP